MLKVPKGGECCQGTLFLGGGMVHGHVHGMSVCASLHTNYFVQCVIVDCLVRQRHSSCTAGMYLGGLH